MLYIIRPLLILPQYLAIGFIRFYQRFISHRKGFCCAYHKRVGGRSCSSFALVAVRRYGISALWRLFPKRLDNCKIVAMCLNEDNKKKDNSCGCDAPDCSCDGWDCDFSLKHQFYSRYFSFSPFFLLKWMYKISSKRRSRFR